MDEEEEEGVIKKENREVLPLSDWSNWQQPSAAEKCQESTEEKKNRPVITHARTHAHIQFPSWALGGSGSRDHCVVTVGFQALF